MNKSPGRGRRSGGPDTRGQILAAARQLFLAGGYQAVTMRQVAAAAGVDLALVSYYFGSKRGLFGAAVTDSANPADVIARAVGGDLATLPQRALRDLLILWDDPGTGTPLKAMVGGIGQNPDLAALVREMLERELITRLAARLGGADAERRAAAFCSQIAGIVVTRYILRLEPVASLPADEIIRTFGPALHTVLRPAPPRAGPDPVTRLPRPGTTHRSGRE